MNTKVKALWQAVHVQTPAFIYQDPPLTKVSACTITGMHALLVQLELGRSDCELSGQGQEDGVPFVVIQHTDDNHQTWQTHVKFPQMEKHHVWAASVYTDHMKIAFAEDTQ